MLGLRELGERKTIPNVYVAAAQAVLVEVNRRRDVFANTTSCKLLHLDRVLEAKARIVKAKDGALGVVSSRLRRRELLVYVVFSVNESATARYQANVALSVAIDLDSVRAVRGRNDAAGATSAAATLTANVLMSRQVTLYKTMWACADSRININWCLCDLPARDPK